MGNEMFFYITIIRIVFGNKLFYKINSYYSNVDYYYKDRIILIHSLKDFVFHFTIKRTNTIYRRLLPTIYDLIEEISYSDIFIDVQSRVEFVDSFRSFLNNYSNLIRLTSYCRRDIKHITRKDLVTLLKLFKNRFSEYEKQHMRLLWKEKNY